MSTTTIDTFLSTPDAPVDQSDIPAEFAIGSKATRYRQGQDGEWHKIAEYEHAAINSVSAHDGKTPGLAIVAVFLVFLTKRIGIIY